MNRCCPFISWTRQHLLFKEGQGDVGYRGVSFVLVAGFVATGMVGFLGWRQRMREGRGFSASESRGPQAEHGDPLAGSDPGPPRRSTFVTIALIILGFVILVVAILAIQDLTQRQHAMTRNFPVIGHFRYSSRRLGIPCASICSRAIATNDRTTVSPVPGCMPRQRVRTTSSDSDPRLTRDWAGWSSCLRCIRRSRLAARARPNCRGPR